MPPPLLEIRNATIFRGHTRVFSNFSLSIPQRQSIAILGPNGAGKTTLLKLLNRELYPVQDGGSVTLLGKTHWVLQDLRKQIGVLSHDLQQAYRKGVSGIDVVLSGFCSSVGVHGIPLQPSYKQRELSRQIMTDLGIDRLQQTPLSEMSTGQQRRCLLARALVHRPKTLILDEPTAGLDLQAAFKYLNILRELHHTHHNLVLVTHHLSEIPPEVTRVVLLRNGVVVADGDKRGLMNSRTLSDFFNVRLKIVESNGFFLAHPD